MFALAMPRTMMGENRRRYLVTMGEDVEAMETHTGYKYKSSSQLLDIIKRRRRDLINITSYILQSIHITQLLYTLKLLRAFLDIPPLSIVGPSGTQSTSSSLPPNTILILLLVTKAHQLLGQTGDHQRRNPLRVR